MLNSTVSIAARSSTSCVRMWRPSGRGWTVIPWQPASMHVRAACTTLGRSPPRALRSVAILLRLTLSLVMGENSQKLIVCYLCHSEQSEESHGSEQKRDLSLHSG